MDTNKRTATKLPDHQLIRLAAQEHPERVLPAGAKRRGRGAWSDRPTQGAKIIWGQAPARGGGCAGCGETRREVHEVREDHESLTYFEGDALCGSCASDAGLDG